MNNNNRGAVRRVNRRNNVTRLRRELRGFSVAPRKGGPPRVTLRPYYPLVVQKTHEVATTVLSISPSLVAKWISTQLGFGSQSTANLVFKLKAIRIWSYQYGPADDRVEVNGEIGSLVPTVGDPTSGPPAVHYPVLYKFQDFGTLDEPAAAGYNWPLNHQQVPLYADSNFDIAEVVSNSKNLTIQLHLEWSTAEVQPPPA